MSPPVPVFQEWDFTSMEFRTPTFNGAGAQEVKLVDPETQRPPKIQLEYHEHPNTVCFVDKMNEGQPLRRAFGVHQFQEKTLEKMKEFDAFIKKSALKNSKLWFKKEISEQEIEFRHKCIVEEKTVGGVKSYVLKAKMKLPGHQVQTRLHFLTPDMKVAKNMGTADMVKPPAKVVMQVSMYAMWFMAGGGFGISLQAEEMTVMPMPEDQKTLSHFASIFPIEMVEEGFEPPPEAKRLKTEDVEEEVTTEESVVLEDEGSVN